jgi:hypothetical protein
VADFTLNHFREALLDDPEARPVERRRRIFVDRDGRIVVGDAPDDRDARRLSEIHPAVFAARG